MMMSKTGSGPLLLLLLLALLFLLAAAPTEAQTAAAGEGEEEEEEGGEGGEGEGNEELEIIDLDTAHRAKYAVMRQLIFADEKEARKGLKNLEENAGHGFSEMVEKLNRRAHQLDRPARSGEMGFVSYEEVEPEVATWAFDVRNPLTHEKFTGPICTENGCFVFSVMNRYRSHFFSDAFYDAEAYAKKLGMRTAELLDAVDGDAGHNLAMALWPDEHISHIRIKLDHLRQDLKRIGSRDWSAEPEHLTQEEQDRRSGKHSDLRKHNAMMEQKKRMFAKIPKETKGEHPEIWGMDPEQLLESGFLTDTEGLEDIVRHVKNKKLRAKESADKLRRKEKQLRREDASVPAKPKLPVWGSGRKEKKVRMYDAHGRLVENPDDPYDDEDTPTDSQGPFDAHGSMTYDRVLERKLKASERIIRAEKAQKEKPPIPDEEGEEEEEGVGAEEGPEEGEAKGRMSPPPPRGRRPPGRKEEKCSLGGPSSQKCGGGGAADSNTGGGYKGDPEADVPIEEEHEEEVEEEENPSEL